MERFRIYCVIAGMVAWLSVEVAQCEESPDTAHTISGLVMELRSGTADVPVCFVRRSDGVATDEGNLQAN